MHAIDAMNKLLINTLPKREQYLYSIISVVAVSAICFLLSPAIGYRVVALILLLTVSLIAVLFDILPVLATAALTALIWDFFFIPPRFNFHVDTTEDTIVLVMYFVIALINGVLTYKIRRVEKTARQKEERANSVKLYNTILNSLSHELRTPIATIIGATDNLQTNRHLSDTNRNELLEEIAKAGFRLNQQVENLLNISRLESGHIKPKSDWCDVEELVYEVVKQVEETNPARNIGIHIPGNMPLCYLDKGMLEQVLYNLLNNAAIHTSAKSAIDITASCHTDLLEVIIEDGGHGFTESELKDVFRKFSRERNMQTSGSGLGLSIVKGFTEALGGHVDVAKSALGGARFTVIVPVQTTYMNLA